MSANDIILYFSIFISVCVVIWAVLIIRAYNKIDRDNR